MSGAGAVPPEGASIISGDDEMGWAHGRFTDGIVDWLDNGFVSPLGAARAAVELDASAPLWLWANDGSFRPTTVDEHRAL